MNPSPLAFAVFAVTLPLPGLVAAARAGLHRSGLGPGGLGLLALLLSVAITSVTALSAAAAGVFSLPMIVALNGGIAFILAVTRGGGPVREAVRALAPRLQGLNGVRLISVVLLLAAAVWLYARPYEYFAGGWDPGVYTNAGANIARTGAIAIHDEPLARLSPEVRGLFLHRRRNLEMKYPGFLLRDGAGGRVQPYFNHLFPVWIAILDAGFGPRGGLYVGALFMLLSVGIMALLGSLLFDRTVGLTAACLFGLSIPVLWQARFPTAEPVALLFTLAGWIGVTLFLRNGGGAVAVLTGLFFACALLAKITSFLPVLLLLGATLVLLASQPAPGRAWLPGSLVAALFLAAFAGIGLSREYWDVVARAVLVQRFGSPLILGACLAAAAGAVWMGGVLARRHCAALRLAGAVFAVAAGIFLYFIRPAVERSPDARNLVELGWFVSPLVLVLALLGVLAVLRRPGEGPAGQARLLFVAVATTAALAVLYRKQVTPVYLWALRRYVPEVLPALALFASVAVSGIRERGESAASRRRAFLAGAMVVIAAALGLVRGRHLILHRDYAGALSAIERTADLIPRGALTVCTDSWLATPLQYVFGRETFALSDPTPEKSVQAAQAVTALAEEGKEVYLATDGRDFFTNRLSLEPVGGVRFDLPVLERSSSHYPRAVSRFAPEVALFRVHPLSHPSAHRPTRISIATAPFGIGRGFYLPERQDHAGKTMFFRWTADEATIEIPMPARPDGSWYIELMLAGGRPAGVPDPAVDVLLDGKPVASFTVGSGFAPFRIAVPAGISSADRDFHELTLHSATFVPARVSSSGDARTLGVMWESAAVRQEGA